MRKLWTLFFNLVLTKPLDQMGFLHSSIKSPGVQSRMISSTLCMHFFHSGSLLKSLNHTYITLIPKCLSLRMLCTFFPLVYAMWCIKPYSRYLSIDINRLWTTSQPPSKMFSSKGGILQIISLFLMRSLIPCAKKGARKKSFGALKIDMSKAYDRLDWNFLKGVLLSMRFSPKWVNWIMKCVTTVSYTH